MSDTKGRIKEAVWGNPNDPTCRLCGSTSEHYPWCTHRARLALIDYLRLVERRLTELEG